jgi:hypothetical protein
MTKKALNVDIDEELWLKLEKVRAEGITKASVVEIALEDFFARENYTDYLDKHPRIRKRKEK